MSYFKCSKMSSSSTIEMCAPVGFYVLWYVLIHDQKVLAWSRDILLVVVETRLTVCLYDMVCPCLHRRLSKMSSSSTIETCASWSWLRGLAFDTRLASSLMPGAPNVRKYSTFLNGLHHSPPRMKNQHGSMRKKPYRRKNCLSLSAKWRGMCS